MLRNTDFFFFVVFFFSTGKEITARHNRTINFHCALAKRYTLVVLVVLYLHFIFVDARQ